MTACLVVCCSLLGVCVPRAGAGILPLPVLQPPGSASTVAPVAASSTADPPVGSARGTMILVYGGGWAGHSARRAQALMTAPGELFRQRGWRVVSIDYEAGTAGLLNLVDAARDELARKTGGGPLCIYGESSGAQLALVAASQLRWIDCVVGVGAPTDLALYESEGRSDADPRVRQVAERMSAFFGTTPDALGPWSPVMLAPAIRADVMLVRERDDALVGPEHAARFQALRPTTQLVTLEAGDAADPSTQFVHGTVSEAGRARYASAIGSFADRAVAAHVAEHIAAHAGCAKVRRSVAEVGPRGLLSALRCLARSDARLRLAAPGPWERSILNMHGEVNAGRVWASLRRTTSGRRALVASTGHRASITVRTGDPSGVVVRRSPSRSPR